MLRDFLPDSFEVPGSMFSGEVRIAGEFDRFATFSGFVMVDASLECYELGHGFVPDSHDVKV